MSLVVGEAFIEILIAQSKNFSALKADPCERVETCQGTGS